MSKPLELTVHPKRLVDSGFHRVEADGSFSALRVEEWLIDGVWVRGPFRTHKRLTDAELAADYWGVRATLEGGLITSHDLTVPWRNECAAIRDSMTPAGQRIREQVDTLLRFATLPHYDEATA